jgi:CSLREA domain-containing protein
MKLKLFRRGVAAITVAAAALVTAPAAAAQSVFVVTSAGDSADLAPGNGVCLAAGNVCTLRAAIQEANALPGSDVIRFAIGSGIRTIVLTAMLPAVTEAVLIDGWTQPGFAGTPLIDINGAGRAGLAITGGGAVVRGLVLRNIAGHAIVLATGGGNVLAGNYIGMMPNGRTASPNSGHGIVVFNSSNNRIGGTAPVQANLISRNTGTGVGGAIVVQGGSGNIIQGNLIGTDITGLVAQPNEASGISIVDSSNNLIGGPDAGAANLISANRTAGVRIAGLSSQNVVQANLIGLNRDLTGLLPNDRGVQISEGASNKVLGNFIVGNAYDGVLLSDAMNTLVEGNTIAYNGYGPADEGEEPGYFGVWVLSGTGNQLLSNQIFGNFHLGINLNGDLVTPNDLGDVDGGANNTQNHPTILGADRIGSVTLITGSLATRPNGMYRVQFFVNPTCDAPAGVGEGQYFLGETTIATNNVGGGAFSFSFNGLLPVGWAVSGTATDAAGNTSEFAPCRNVR